MVHVTKENGPIIWPVAKESSAMLEEISTMVCGQTTRQTALESTQTQKVLAMKVSGKMTNSMEKELKTGQTGPSMKDTTIWA